MLRISAGQGKRNRIVSATLPGRQQFLFVPSAGIAIIDGMGYRVREFPEVNGRGFRFDKIGGGGYDVFLANLQETLDDSCECMGHTRHSHCKHIDAARAIADQTKREGF